MKKILFFLSLFTAISVLVLPACQGGTTTVYTTQTVTVPTGNAIGYSADMNGQKEVPPVSNNMTGHFDITFDSRLATAVFRLTITNAEGIISSQLHLGGSLTSGPAIASLFSSPTGATAPTLIITGTLTDSSLMGEVGTIADLAVSIQAGAVYVDAHSETTPSGAIRGQISPSGQPLPAGGNVITVIVTPVGFNPPSLTISAGTTIEWYNTSSQPLEIKTASGTFGAVINPGTVYEYTFTELATYVYYLANATGITGTINIS